MELENRPVKETFTLRHLLLPGSESPTKTSGLIVYITSALTCKSFFTDNLPVNFISHDCVCNSHKNVLSTRGNNKLLNKILQEMQTRNREGAD